MKNLAKYSIPEDIGTIHWYRTLVGTIKRMGEFIKAHPRRSVLNQAYGIYIENATKDLLEWQETKQPLR